MRPGSWLDHHSEFPAVPLGHHLHRSIHPDRPKQALNHLRRRVCSVDTQNTVSRTQARFGHAAAIRDGPQLKPLMLLFDGARRGLVAGRLNTNPASAALHLQHQRVVSIACKRFEVTEGSHRNVISSKDRISWSESGAVRGPALPHVADSDLTGSLCSQFRVCTNLPSAKAPVKRLEQPLVLGIRGLL